MLGENPLFTWKSKSTHEKEAAEYEKWAFPYGAQQRQNLEALLTELFPKENLANVLIPFLTCKELYETALKNHGTEDATTDFLINKLKKYKMVIRKKEMPIYIAIVLADRKIDDAAIYEPAAEVCEKARELELLRKK